MLLSAHLHSLHPCGTDPAEAEQSAGINKALK